MIRRLRSWTVHGVAVTLLAWVAGCIQIGGGTQQRRLVDLNDGTMARRMEVAQQYVNERQLGLLRASAKRQFPSLTDGDLATLGLSWERMTMGDGDHVMIVVTFMPTTQAVDAAAVADYLAGQVRDELRLKLKSRQMSAVEPSALVAPPNKALKLTRSAMASGGAALAA